MPDQSSPRTCLVDHGDGAADMARAGRDVEKIVLAAAAGLRGQSVPERFASDCVRLARRLHSTVRERRPRYYAVITTFSQLSCLLTNMS